jgi:DNA (cytosine-5)-methyltransferase 1
VTTTIGSLFSGIGGLELGLEWAGLGPTTWQVERDPYCLRILERHWPEAERFDDVCAVGIRNLARVDLICGGFPCQDVSAAGKGAGLAGDRSGLWREFARVVSELQPEWVVVENVRSGANRWLDAVVRDLEQLNYGVLPIPLSASDVGAPHIRERVFLVAQSKRIRREAVLAQVANPDGVRQSQSQRLITDERRRVGHQRGQDVGPWSAESRIRGVAHGVPNRAHRLRGLGNAVVPQCAEVVGWVVRELMDAS